MTRIALGQRLYFAAVGALALWVGVWGYFIPTRIDQAIPWLVPPLHARFLGSMYLSGATFMAGCLLARRWAEVRVVMPMIAIWTGMLFIISFFYLNTFDLRGVSTYVWWLAYFFYPLIAAWYAWRGRGAPIDAALPRLPLLARLYLAGQGVVTTVLALALLFAPSLMTRVWPWKITPMLAHLYSAPFLSYGVGSLLLAGRKTWLEVRIALAAIWVFAAGVLLASLIHRALFSPAGPATWLWFGGFFVAAGMLALLSLAAWLSAAWPLLASLFGKAQRPATG